MRCLQKENPPRPPEPRTRRARGPVCRRDLAGWAGRLRPTVPRYRAPLPLRLAQPPSNPPFPLTSTKEASRCKEAPHRPTRCTKACTHVNFPVTATAWRSRCTPPQAPGRTPGWRVRRPQLSPGHPPTRQPADRRQVCCRTGAVGTAPPKVGPVLAGVKCRDAALMLGTHKQGPLVGVRSPSPGGKRTSGAPPTVPAARGRRVPGLEAVHRRVPHVLPGTNHAHPHRAHHHRFTEERGVHVRSRP